MSETDDIVRECKVREAADMGYRIGQQAEAVLLFCMAMNLRGAQYLPYLEDFNRIAEDIRSLAHRTQEESRKSKR